MRTAGCFAIFRSFTRCRFYLSLSLVPLLVSRLHICARMFSSVLCTCLRSFVSESQGHEIRTRHSLGHSFTCSEVCNICMYGCMLRVGIS